MGKIYRTIGDWFELGAYWISGLSVIAVILYLSYISGYYALGLFASFLGLSILYKTLMT